MNMTARFKYESHFIKKIQQTYVGGTYNSKEIMLSFKEVDFDIVRYVEYKYHYDIIVCEKDVNLMDGGETIIIINVPKDMITIANKENKNERI